MSKQKTRAPHLLLVHWRKESYLQLVKSKEINKEGIILSHLTINDILYSHIKNRQNDLAVILTQINAIANNQLLVRLYNIYKTELMLLKLKIHTWLIN